MIQSWVITNSFTAWLQVGILDTLRRAQLFVNLAYDSAQTALEAARSVALTVPDEPLSVGCVEHELVADDLSLNPLEERLKSPLSGYRTLEISNLVILKPHS